MRFKIISAPGDHRDDFRALEDQLNAWAAEVKPRIISIHTNLAAMTDQKNIGRYIKSVLVAYETETA